MAPEQARQNSPRQGVDGRQDTERGASGTQHPLVAPEAELARLHLPSRNKTFTPIFDPNHEKQAGSQETASSPYWKAFELLALTSVATLARLAYRKVQAVPVVPDRAIAAEASKEAPQRSTELVDKQQSAGVGPSIRTACQWMWKASAVACATLTAAAVMTGYFTYRILEGGRAVTDNLQSLAAGRIDSLWPAFASAIEVGAFSFLVALSGVLYAKSKSYFQMRFNQTVRSESLGAIFRFSTSELQRPAIVTECNKVLMGRFAMQEFGRGIFNAVTAVSGVGFAIYALSQSASDWRAVVLVASFVPIYLLHALRQGRDKLEALQRTLHAHDRFSTLDWSTGASAQAIEVRVHGKTTDLQEHLAAEKRKLDDSDRIPENNQLRRDGWLQPFNSVVLTCLGVHALADLAFKLITNAPNTVSIGSYGMTVGALIAANTSFASLSSAITTIVKELPIIRSVKAVLDKTSDRVAQKDEELALEAPASAPSISMRNVSFAYPAKGDEPPKLILKDVSLEIGAGEMVAIVGPSGCGKTTLLKLLCNVLEGPKDSIFFDDTSLSDMTAEEAHAQVAYSQQESVAILATTVKDNVMVGARRLMTDADVWQCLEASGFADDMRAKGWTLDHVVGHWIENGIGLSGGQTTRLALARLYATGAKLVVLDEPTANLDQEGTDRVLSRLKEQTTHTRIVVAHDYGIARNADRIIVMDQGRIVDVGTHRELLKRCGVYRKNFGAQATRLLGSLTEFEIDAVRGSAKGNESKQRKKRRPRGES